MIVGVLCFVVGYIFYSSPTRETESIKHPSNDRDSTTTLSVPVVDSSTSTAPLRAPQKIFNANELEKIVDMAVADGVLTPNERKLVEGFASSRGLDYDEIIRDVEKRIAASEDMAETEIVDINKKQGNDFEKFVVHKFDKKFFNLKEWAGDKYVNGTYAQTTQHPDLLLELDLKKETAELSVECKWRSSFHNDGIVFATSDQLKRYQNFEASRNTPVFIAIGIGGSGAKPEQLYVVPLNKIKSSFIHANVLKKYKKRIDSDFFYDIQTQELR